MEVKKSQTTDKSGIITTENKRARKVLYKYTNMDFIESCIINGIYASRIDAVNDPFESFGIKYPHLYRICCMTNSPKQMLLWAYYTNHKECCVEFDTAEIDTNLLRHVDYVKTFSAHADMTLDEISSSLYRKGKEWEHENEYRAVFYKKMYDEDVWKLSEDNVYLKANVKSVTFGLFADNDLQRYKTALEILIKYGIVGKKCRLKDNSYALEDDRQFDLAIELEKVISKINKQQELRENVSLDLDEQRALKRFLELQDSPFTPVPFEKISAESELILPIKKLLEKGILMLQYTQEKSEGFKFYYTVTQLGEKYM